MSGPPKPSELCKNAVNLPAELDAFLYTLLTHNTEIPTEYHRTSHGVNGIAVQARHFGPNLPPPPEIEQARTKKRSIDLSVISVSPSEQRW